MFIKNEKRLPECQIAGARAKSFQVLQNNPGSGSFQISLQDTVGGNPELLANDNLVLVKLDGNPIFKWVIEQRNPMYVDAGEHPTISVTGRGALSLLDRAVVYPEKISEPQLDRVFTGTAATILRQLILEAQRRGGLQGIVVDWSDDQDSIGNIFTEQLTLSFHVGTPLSEVLTKFTTGLGYFVIEMTPSLVLKIYQERGVDHSDTIIYRPGQAIIRQQNQYDSSKMVNEVLIEGQDRKLAIAAQPTSQAQYGRREGYLSAGNVREGLGEYGQAYLSRAAFPAWNVQGEVVQFQDKVGVRLRPLESFLIGDWITWTVAPEGNDTGGFREKLRVQGVTVKEADDTNLLTYSLDLNNTTLEYEIRLNQQVERMSQFTGSDVLSVAPSSSGSYSESEVQQLLNQKAAVQHAHVFRDLLDVPDTYTGQSGKAVVVKSEENGLTFQSLAGGSAGMGNLVDEPPLSPHSMNDEFTDEALASKWSWVNQGSAAWVENKRFGAMDITSGTNHTRLLIQPAPLGDFTVTAKVNVFGPRLNYFSFGLCLYNGATGRRVIWGKCCRSGYSGMQAVRFTSDTSYSSDPYLQGGWEASSLYVRIRKAGATLMFDQSIDGEFWWTAFSETLSSFMAAISHIGLGAYRNNTSGISYQGNCEWFRVTEP